jgi:hypothetical protein
MPIVQATGRTEDNLWIQLADTGEVWPASNKAYVTATPLVGQEVEITFRDLKAGTRIETVKEVNGESVEDPVPDPAD